MPTRPKLNEAGLFRANWFVRAVVLALFVVVVRPSSADITITMIDDGTDLTVAYSGSLDTSVLPAPSTALTTVQALFRVGALPIVNIAPAASTAAEVYLIPVDAGLPFGTDTEFRATAGFSGSLFTFQNGLLALPDGYTSGTNINGSIMVPGQTVASLGIFPKTVYDIGMSGQTITVQTTPVPEPTGTIPGLAMLFASGWLHRRRRPTKK